jgi:hypothetical protein
MVMTTLSLIDSLASDIKPVSPYRQHREFAIATAIGGGITLCAVILVFGIQPGIDTFAHGAPLAMKTAYTLTLAGIALATALVLARPGTVVSGIRRWLAFPVVGIAATALFELTRLPMSAWPHAVMGSSWQECPWRIATLSIPVFAGLCIALRRQAPTDLRAAGAAAGLLSGAVAATSYALACTESSATFVLVWYSVGIAVATATGAILGPKILRW